jgi:mitochondrial fission protein ELM1
MTDGNLGTRAKTAGIARTLGLEFEHKQVRPRLPWDKLAPWGPVDPREKFGREGSTFSPPWPEIAIAAGRRTIPYLSALRRASEGATFTVLLQHPRTSLDVADLIWCPAHDKLQGANVISTPTTPHVMRPQALADMRRGRIPEIAALRKPLVAVLLGGPNAVFRFDSASIERLAHALSELAKTGASFLITPSQRTTSALFRAVADATRGAQRIVWTKTGPNPYWTFLAHADLTIVTADSVNLTSEACVTGRPVYVFEPDGGSPKFTRFHSLLREYGATRPLTGAVDVAARWSYRPLDAAPAIVGEIARRYRASRQPVVSRRLAHAGLVQPGNARLEG